MTKFDNVQISHRRGRKVADDYGVDDVKLPAGGLEVDEDGWLRVAQADNVGVCGWQSAARLGELDPPCVFFELERADGSDVGVICVEVCNVEVAPQVHTRVHRSVRGTEAIRPAHGIGRVRRRDGLIRRHRRRARGRRVTGRYAGRCPQRHRR